MREVANSGVQILDYAPPKRWRWEWLIRNRRRILVFVALPVALTIAYLQTSISLNSYTTDHATTSTATRMHVFVLGQRVVYRWSEPTTFRFANLIAPTTDTPIQTNDCQLYNRDIKIWHFGGQRSRSDPDLERVQCVSGIYAFSNYLASIWFIQSHMPDATREDRRDVMIEIMRRTASLDPRKDQAVEVRFHAIAEEVLDEMYRSEDESTVR